MIPVLDVRQTVCNTTAMQTELLTAKEAADRKGVSVFTIARWARDGKLPVALRADGKRAARWFRADDVDAAPIGGPRVCTWCLYTRNRTDGVWGAQIDGSGGAS